MFCILPLQDWTSIDSSVRYPGNPEDERINVPANPRHYWRWRMPLTLEELVSHQDFCKHVNDMIVASGRG